MTQKFKYIMLAGLMITSVSCKKALDINTNPYAPTAAPINKLLPTAELNLGLSQTISSGISQVLEVYTHRMIVREDPDQYGASGGDFNIAGHWSTLYVNTLTNLDAIISQGTKDGNLHYVGIAQILKAYAYTQLVDVYGDVPFSEVNKTGIVSPKFDKGADVYAAALTLLDKGIANAGSAGTNVLEPGADDIIYGGKKRGDVDKTPYWVLAGNSLKLKLLVQQRLIKDVSADVTALVAGGKLIATTSESFVIPFGPNAATDDRSPAFNDYFASQRGNYISPWFYEILKGVNPYILAGNADPRRPYYYFKQSKSSTIPGNPIEYRDANGFVSIYFGSLGPNAAQNQQNTMTVLGIYPAGGRYDDAAGGTASATSGTGAAPYRLITYADVLYLEAEMQQIGKLAGSARATLSAALDESFKQVDYVVTNYVKPTQTVPAVAGLATTTAYKTKVLAEYDAPIAFPAPTPANSIASYPSYNHPLAERQLEMIMTQKWLSSFGSAVDAYTDYRRTGYPVMFDPKNPAMAPVPAGQTNGFVQPPINGNPGAASNDPEKPVEVTRAKDYPQTLPWDQTELDRNKNAPKQKNDPSIVKPFWKP
jgi:hypothetical protein